MGMVRMKPSRQIAMGLKVSGMEAASTLGVTVNPESLHDSSITVRYGLPWTRLGGFVIRVPQPSGSGKVDSPRVPCFNLSPGNVANKPR